MRFYKSYPMLLIALALMVLGCSHGRSPIDAGVRETVELSASEENDSHNLLGLYTFICNPEAGTVDIAPLREAELHLNALKFLEPPPYLFLTLEGPPQINGNILDVDIGLRHPFLALPQFTGFDVCGIVFTHGSITGFNDPDIVMSGEGDTRLLNADGYTRWWNPAEFPHGDTIYNYIDGLLGNPADTVDFNCTINGYKYFADGLGKDDPLTILEPAKRGVFSAGMKNIRHYTIDMSGGLIFNYAVDACWAIPQGDPPYNVPDDFPQKANRPEAWNISITELVNSLHHDESTGCSGGHLKILLNVYDHFNAGLNKVYAESSAGLPFTAAPTPIGGGDGFSTYELDFIVEELDQNGEAELFITVQSEVPGYGGILPGKQGSAYFKYVFYISPEGPKGWARTWGDESYESGYGVTTDYNGDIYVTGYFEGNVDFDPGPGTDYHTSEGGCNAFLSKFDLCGKFLWARTWGGTGDGCLCNGLSVVTGDLGEIYITGWFNETVDFDPGPDIDEHSSNGGYDIFLIKFDTEGAFQWAETWGGSYIDPYVQERGNSVAVSPLGNVYVAGEFFETVDFDPGPGIDEHTSNGGRDVFLSKFDSNGELQWAVTWGGMSRDDGSGVDVDDSENAYITGYFYSATVDFDPGPGTDTHTSNGVCDAFLSKIDSSGNFHWARTWGSSLWDYGTAITVDESGDCLVTGGFWKTVDFDPGPGTDEHTSNGDEDVFLSKFDSNGDHQGARTWGGTRHEFAFGITSDVSCNAFITGEFYGTVDFDPGPGIDEHTSNGEEDVFLSKINSNGDFQWARTWGGTNEEHGFGVAADESGNAYVAGAFYSATADFDPGPGVDEHTSNGLGDVFLSKFPPDGNW